VFNISQGLKAGLAGGVVYGLLVGLIHLGILEVCAPSQLQFIEQHISQLSTPTNSTAEQLFSTDLVYFPMINGIWALVYGVLFGAVFAFVYTKLPGTNSKRKGMTLGVVVIFIGLFIGPASYSYTCPSNYFPIIADTAGLASGILFGFVLGVFYDSFGRLHAEQEDEKKKKQNDDHSSSGLPDAAFGR